jgi:hypothetical protein
MRVMKHGVWISVDFYDQFQGGFGKEETPIFGFCSNFILTSVPFLMLKGSRRSNREDCLHHFPQAHNYFCLRTSSYGLSVGNSTGVIATPPGSAAFLLLSNTTLSSPFNGTIVYHHFRLGKPGPRSGFPIVSGSVTSFILSAKFGAMTPFEFALELFKRY